MFRSLPLVRRNCGMTRIPVISLPGLWSRWQKKSNEAAKVMPKEKLGTMVKPILSLIQQLPD